MEYVRLLGSGSFAKAWLVRNQATREMFVLKEAITGTTLAEAKIHASIHHDFLIRWEFCVFWCVSGGCGGCDIDASTSFASSERNWQWDSWVTKTTHHDDDVSLTAWPCFPHL